MSITEYCVAEYMLLRFIAYLSVAFELALTPVGSLQSTIY